MKIIEIIYSLCSGGAERFVVDLSNRLAQNEDDEVIILTVCDLNKSGCSYYLPDVDKKVKVTSLGLSGLSLRTLSGVYKTIKNERPDIVHCHSNLILLYLPVLLCHQSRYIHTLHSLAEKCLVWKWCLPLNKCLYKTKVQAVTISKECSNSYRTLYGYNNDKQVINGREKSILSIALKSVKYVISGFTPYDSPVFINVARCHPQKNHRILFDVFERLTIEGCRAQLIVLGAGHEDNAIRYKNHPNIHIIGERRNVADYLACADFFILSSVCEGLPLTLLEAMSMGVIPVCTPAGGIKDVIRDGENGFLSAGFGVEDLFNAVHKAIERHDSISSETLKEEYQRKYSMEVCSDRYYQLYNSL